MRVDPEAPKQARESATEQQQRFERRGWHAPQFFVAEFAATVVQGNGQSDGASQAPSSS
jgi:hypothetical protein